MVTFSSEPISHSTHTYSNSPMTLVDNAENLASPGLAEQAQPPPYAASPTRSLFNHGGLTWNSVTEMGTAENAAAAVLTESEMSEEGETTSVVHHLQRDSENHSVNTECDLLVGMTMSPSRTNCSDDEGLLFRMPNLLVNTAGGIMSPPRLNFFSEEAPFLTPNFHADMVGGMMMSTSPPRMNYFSPPSGDSIGNSDPYRLWNFADHSEAQELENRKGMTMRPTCIKEVDAVLGQKNQSLGIWAAENMGGTVRQSCWGTHPHPQPQTSDDDSVNKIKVFQLAGGMILIDGRNWRPTDTVLGQKNQTSKLEAGSSYGWFHMPTQFASHDSLPLGGSFYPYRFLDEGAELHNRETITKVTVSWIDVDSELFSHKEFWFNIAVQTMEKGLPVAHTDVHLPQKSVTHPPNAQFGLGYSGLFAFLEKDLGYTFNSMQPIMTSIKMAPQELQNPDSLIRQLHDNLMRLSAELKKCLWKMKLLKLEWTLNSKMRGLKLKFIKREWKLTLKKCEWKLTLKTREWKLKSKKREWKLKSKKREWKLKSKKCEWRLKSLCEGHIPKSNATNEERNNFVELDNSIDDAKGGNSSSHKTDTISRWEKDHGITRQVLERLFGKSRGAAAEILKVSISTFKRACRDFDISRWPQHKRKMPNCSLDQKQHVQAVKKHKGDQSCPALPPQEATTTTLPLPPEEATTTPLQGNSAISVKVTYEDNTIRFPLPSSSTMKYLEEQLETRFKISLENFSILYQDEEDDWISLTCDSDLMYGMDVLRSSGKNVVKMKIKPNFG